MEFGAVNASIRALMKVLAQLWPRFRAKSNVNTPDLGERMEIYGIPMDSLWV